MYYESHFVKPSELKPGDLFSEATDVLRFVFEGFDKLDDAVKTFEPTPFEVFKFTRIDSRGDVEVESVFPAADSWCRFNMDCTHTFRRVIKK